MLRTALQVGVPSSEEKVTLGFALFFEKFSSTQNSLRLCSSSDGAVAKKVVVTSSSDLMLISILTVSSSELAKGAAALAGATVAGRREVMSQRMAMRPTAGMCLRAG